MKKLFLIAALLRLLNVHAQINKGHSMIGLSFNGGSRKQLNTDTTTGFSLYEINNKSMSMNVRYGYFIKNGLMLGVIGGYHYASLIHKTNNNAGNFSDNRQYIEGVSGGVFTSTTR